jgi:hypothetical protein
MCPWIWRASLLCAAAAAYIASFRAWGRAQRPTELSEEGNLSYPKVFWLGSMAGRRYFTDEGWSWQRRARSYAWLGFALVVLTFLTW